MKKRIISLILVFLMVFSLSPWQPLKAPPKAELALTVRLYCCPMWTISVKNLISSRNSQQCIQMKMFTYLEQQTIPM